LVLVNTTAKVLPYFLRN